MHKEEETILAASKAPPSPVRLGVMTLLIGTKGFLLAAFLSFPPLLPANELEVRMTAQMGYDSNVYRVEVGDLGKRSSWTTGLQPSVVWKPLPQWTLQYTAQAEFYTDESGEDNVRHTLLARYAQPGQFLVESAMTRVQGPRDAVAYSTGRSAWATTLVRERREQWQNRSRLEYVWKSEAFFLRPNASLTYFNLDARKRSDLPGWDNWINRYDLRGGIDLGHSLSEDSEVYLGWRYGRQHQGRQGNRPSDRSNKYHQALLGYSGKLTEALVLRVEVGPSFHRYDDPESVGGRAIDAWHLNARASWNPNARDRFSGLASISRGVASTGLLSNELRSFAVDYRRLFEDRSHLTIALGARALSYDARPISDWLYSASLTWMKPLSETLSLQINLTYEEGRDRSPPRAPQREFTRSLLSAQLTYSF